MDYECRFAGTTKLKLVTAAAELNHRCNQNGFALQVVMRGVTCEAGEPCLVVGSAQVCLVAHGARLSNGSWARGRETQYLVGIARLGMLSTGTVAAFAALLRNFWTLQGLQVFRRRKSLVRILVASLTDFYADVFTSCRVR